MFYSDLVRKAAQISFEAHKGDTDKSDYPYFMHPMILAVQFDDEASVCVALLHDVIEDHGDKYSFDYLKKEGFPEETINALKLLTHEEGAEYLEYVKAIKQNPIARKVKLADLRHNSDVKRCSGVKPPKYELYLKAIELLEFEESTNAVFNWDNIVVGAAKYDSLMKTFNSVDVSKDEEFQKRFTGFYKVRRSKDRFLKKYYSLMESLKGKETSYKEIINIIYSFEGHVEASFSSKMLATLNPDMPIWDQYVLANAGIKAPRYCDASIEMCIAKYEQLKFFYKDFLKTEEARAMIAEFDVRLPKYKHFTDIKKIDLMFWQRR